MFGLLPFPLVIVSALTDSLEAQTAALDKTAVFFRNSLLVSGLATCHNLQNTIYAVDPGATGHTDMAIGPTSE
jgi:hypothetical protein